MPRRPESSEVTSHERRSSLGLFLLWCCHCAEKREHIKPKVLFVLETGLPPARTKPHEPQQKAKKSYISDGRVLKLILGSSGRGRSLQTQSPPGQTASNLAVSGSGYPPALSVRLVRMGQRNPAPETPRTHLQLNQSKGKRLPLREVGREALKTTEHKKCVRLVMLRSDWLCPIPQSLLQTLLQMQCPARKAIIYVFRTLSSPVVAVDTENSPTGIIILSKRASDPEEIPANKCMREMAKGRLAWMVGGLLETLVSWRGHRSLRCEDLVML